MCIHVTLNHMCHYAPFYNQCCSPPMHDTSGEIERRFQGRSTAWLRSPPENSSVCCTAFANLGQSPGDSPADGHVMGRSWGYHGCLPVGFNHQLRGCNMIQLDMTEWCTVPLVMCNLRNEHPPEISPRSWNRNSQGHGLPGFWWRKSCNAMTNWENSQMLVEDLTVRN